MSVPVDDGLECGDGVRRVKWGLVWGPDKDRKLGSWGGQRLKYVKARFPGDGNMTWFQNPLLRTVLISSETMLLTARVSHG
jgi:hypothetical protein